MPGRSVAGTPIQTRFAGRPNGVSRYEVEIETCPFSLDVLEGAVLVTRTPQTCDFRAADCRVDPAGLWGPPGNAIGPDQTKQLERERGRVDLAMPAKFHALLASAGKDKEAIKQIASEQAGFSSERESDLPQLFARGYSRILRAADHPGPSARLAGGVRGSREGKGETGDGEKETGGKFQTKFGGQSQAGTRPRAAIESEVRVAALFPIEKHSGKDEVRAEVAGPPVDRNSSAGTGICYPFGKNPASIVMAEGTRRQGEKCGSRLRTRAGIDG